MLNDRLKAAQSVANELFPAEQDIENAILRTSRLAAAIIEGRRAARLSIATGQVGLTEICSAQLALVNARGHIAAAHFELEKTRVEIGLRAVSFGDILDCPAASIAEKTPLRSVA